MKTDFTITSRNSSDVHGCWGPGCNARISGHRQFCSECNDKRGEIPLKELTPGTTHVIELYELSGKDSEVLTRGDGMLVAVRHSDKVIFGHDQATMQARVFRSVELAGRFLRRMADVDLAAQKQGRPLVAEPVCMESGIVLMRSGMIYDYMDTDKYPIGSAVIEERDGDVNSQGNSIIMPGKIGDGASLRM